MFGKKHRIRLPNFLIVGAAKAGTTSIAEYLEQHPRVFMSPIKEPKFISSHFLTYPLKGPGDDFVEAFTIKTLQEYQELFRKVRRHRAIGEASVENLYYHSQAIPVIERLLGADVRIIIVLRDPVERACSAYRMMVRDGREERSFEEGLALEEQRKAQNWEYLWFYRDVGMYYEQVKSYLDAFPNTKVVLFDDLRKNAVEFMQDLFRFLGVRDTFVPRAPIRVNVSGRFRSVFYKMLFKATWFKGMLYRFLSLNGVPDSAMLGVIDSIREGDLEPIRIGDLSKQILRQTFRGDILNLQKLIGRDLSAWLE